MVLEFILKALDRHFNETRLLIDQLTDENIHSEPVQTGRPLGEIVLHMIRAFEFYSRGTTTDVWEPLPYNLDSYNTASDIKTLYESTLKRTKEYLARLPPEEVKEIIKPNEKSASRLSFLMEMLEHSIQHRGQILVYYRLIGLEPSIIPYLV